MLEKIIDGGPLMVPLLVCSIIALAVILDRARCFRNNARIDHRSLRAKVMEKVQEDDLQEAIRLCSNTPGPVSAVLLSGLQAYRKLEEADTDAKGDYIRLMVGRSMEDFTKHAMSAVEKRINVLSTIGNAAPLLGMTGTVTGMIASFGGLADAGQLDASVVAGGIAEALTTTASGLMIALFAVIPYHYFTSRAETIELEIDEALTELVEFLSARHPSA